MVLIIMFDNKPPIMKFQNNNYLNDFNYFNKNNIKMSNIKKNMLLNSLVKRIQDHEQNPLPKLISSCQLRNLNLKKNSKSRANASKNSIDDLSLNISDILKINKWNDMVITKEVNISYKKLQPTKRRNKSTISMNSTTKFFNESLGSTHKNGKEIREMNKSCIAGNFRRLNFKILPLINKKKKNMKAHNHNGGPSLIKIPPTLHIDINLFLHNKN